MATDLKSCNTYFIDSENPEETGRLTIQDRLYTQAMGGVLGEQPDDLQVRDALDLACGPGGWVLDLAFAKPKAWVVGIDNSSTTINYARAQAEVQGLDNAEFRVMNALEPLSFADGSFDLINGRFLISFMPKMDWPRLLRECFRLLRPGGIMRLTEADVSSSANCPHYLRIGQLITSAMWRANRTFASDGLGITAMLPPFLRGAGFQDIQMRPHALDCSWGSPLHESLTQNFLLSFQLLKPFLLSSGLTTPEEFDELYRQAEMEVNNEVFHSIWYGLTVWGKKAAVL